MEDSIDQAAVERDRAEQAELEAEGQALFDQFLGDAPAANPEPSQAGPADDEAGDDESNATPAEGSDEGDAADADPTSDVLEKLRRAQKDAGKAGYQLGQERQKNAELTQQLDQLQSRLAALEGGQQPQQQPQQQQAQPQPQRVPPETIDAYMAQRDPNWAENKEDPYMRAAAEYAIQIGADLAQTLREEYSPLAQEVQDVKFNGRLERLGISRDQFDAIWQDPAYSWGQALTNDQRLAALESQARIPGSRPSAAPGPDPSAGAPTTSRVDPRRTIETDQSQGTVNNPTRLSQLKLEKALDEGDMRTAKDAAAPLFKQLMGG